MSIRQKYYEELAKIDKIKKQYKHDSWTNYTDGAVIKVTNSKP